MENSTNNISQAFLTKIEYAYMKLQDSLSGSKQEVDKALKYLKLIGELSSQMTVALKNTAEAFRITE